MNLPSFARSIVPLKIAVVSPLATVAPHFETELEILERHLDEGDTVELLSCAGALPCCDFNPQHVADQCRSCFGRRQAGLKLLSGRVRSVQLSSSIDGSRLPDATRFRTIDELKAIRVGAFDLGYAVASSLISLTRNPRPELDEHRLLVTRLLHAALATYGQVLDYVTARRPDRVYVFNGRFAAVRGVLRACQQTGIDCWIHERGCDTGHFQIYRNHLPHEIEYLQGRMRAAWNESPRTLLEKTRVADQWFHDRVARSERSWHSFVKDQTRGALPATWNPSRRNVVLFTSSEDEFAAIGDTWRPPFYATQFEGIERLVRDLPAVDATLRLYVRVHPNLKGQDTPELRKLLELNHPQIEILPPDDPTDSYQLVREAEKVVTFGSSVGIEALYWGRPSVLLGTGYYRGFRGIHQPTDHPDAVRLLTSALPPAEDKIDALIYGFWFQTHGIPFRYFEADGLFSGRFKGQVVHAPLPRPPLPVRWLHKVHRVVTGRRGRARRITENSGTPPTPGNER